MHHLNWTKKNSIYELEKNKIASTKFDLECPCSYELQWYHRLAQIGYKVGSTRIYQ